MSNNIPYELYVKALTHPSYANEHGGEHNEKLEFLGDSVLQLCVTELLVAELIDCDEGQLSQARHMLVNNVVLAEIAKKLGLGALIRLGKGHRVAGERVLANAFEAMLGALYLHRGIEDCHLVIRSHFIQRLESALKTPPKRLLHEWSQKTYHSVPEYEIVRDEGPAHSRIYHSVVRINRATVAYGKGRTKQESTIDAAKNAVSILGLK